MGQTDFSEAKIFLKFTSVSFRENIQFSVNDKISKDDYWCSANIIMVSTIQETANTIKFIR